MYIYSITNTVNGKSYVGQTVGDVPVRFAQHVKDARRFPERRLSKAIMKYGPDTFEVRLLGSYSSLLDMNLAERLWIILLRSTEKQYGYNTSAGGNGWGKRSMEQRATISNRQIGKTINEAQKRGLELGRQIRAKQTRGAMSSNGANENQRSSSGI